MMSINFSTFFERLRQVTDIDTQMGLADAVGVNRSAITQAKTRNAVPQKWILTLARRYQLSPDWLEFGTGAPRSRTSPQYFKPQSGTTGSRERHAVIESNEMCAIPKSAARLCAGGGSFEVDATPVAEFLLPRSWLASLGTPESMVFMDVVGDSMEPGICDGDMVLIDRNTRVCIPSARSILAVGVEDAIYLKRMETMAGRVRLLSDNPAYEAMDLSGDELDNFRILGKLVWLCREYG